MQPRKHWAAESPTLPPEPTLNRHPRPYAGSTITSHRSTTSRHSFGKEEVHECIDILERTIESSSVRSFSFACVIVSFLNCKVGDLHKHEISAMLLRVFSEDMGLEQLPTEEELTCEWLKECRELVVEDGRGYVDFANNNMRHFLHHFGMEAVDTTHKTIATACLKQIEVNHIPVVRRRPNSTMTAEPDPELATTSRYAILNWEEHYREAEKSSPAVAARLHRLLQRDFQPAPQPAPHFSPASASHDPISCDLRFSITNLDMIKDAITFCRNHKFVILGRAYEMTCAGMMKREPSSSMLRRKRSCATRDASDVDIRVKFARLDLFTTSRSVIAARQSQDSTGEADTACETRTSRVSRTPSRDSLQDWEIVTLN